MALPDTGGDVRRLLATEERPATVAWSRNGAERMAARTMQACMFPITFSDPELPFLFQPAMPTGSSAALVSSVLMMRFLSNPCHDLVFDPLMGFH